MPSLIDALADHRELYHMIQRAKRSVGRVYRTASAREWAECDLRLLEALAWLTKAHRYIEREIADLPPATGLDNCDDPTR